MRLERVTGNEKDARARDPLGNLDYVHTVSFS